MEIPTRSELRKLKVVELRQKLSKESLPQGGEYQIKFAIRELQANANQNCA